jgi:hypothetical protein
MKDRKHLPSEAGTAAIRKPSAKSPAEAVHNKESLSEQIATFISLIRQCPKPREIQPSPASFHKAFGRLELCELEILMHSS